MVLRIDRDQKKIALSLKAAQPKEEKAAEPEEEEPEVPKKPPRPEPRSCGAESGIRPRVCHFTYEVDSLSPVHGLPRSGIRSAVLKRRVNCSHVIPGPFTRPSRGSA